MKKVKNVMNDIIVTCEQRDSLYSVAKKMLKGDVASIPIIGEDKRLLGMISDRDVTLALGKNENRPGAELTVNDAMSNEAEAVSPEDNIETVLRIMRRKRLKFLPVVDHQKRLRGIVSLHGIVKKINGVEDEKKIAENGNESIARFHFYSESN